jgi:hypothetical protein
LAALQAQIKAAEEQLRKLKEEAEKAKKKE